ncbi:unnamed protein product [Trichobilharzia szidati]|nr:unnamed protein product [Trichobilharzia szidati]
MTMPAQNANQFFTPNNTTSNSSSSSISNNNSSSSTSGISSSSNYTTTNNTTIGMNNSISMSSSVTISSSSSSNHSHSQALDIHHHRTSGSFGSASRNPTNVSPATNSNSTPNNTNKYLFFMECSPASGKGRGSYVFEIDGSRLVELTIAIEQFTALRYNSNLKPATSAEAAQLTVAAQSALGTSSFNAVDCCNNIFRSNPVCALQPNGCIVHDDAANNNNNIASSFSSDTSSNPRSISPTHHHHHQQQQHRNQQQQQQQQQQLRKRRSRDSIFNPLRKISSGHHNFNLFNKTSDYQASTIDRIPPNKQVIAPQLNSQSSVPVMHSSSKCSWSLQRTSSLSPPDMLTNNDLVGDAYNSNSLSRPTSTTTTTNENTFKGASSCSISAVQAAISAINNIQEGNNSPIDLASLLTKSLQNHDVSIPNHQDQSIAINNHHPVTSSSICSHSPLFIGSSAVHGGVVQHHHHHHHQHSHLPPSYRLNDDTPTLCSSASLTATSTTTSGYDLIDNMSDTNYFLHDNVQVAKVAAGLIISKKPPYYYNNNTSTANNNVVCAYPTRTTCCLTSICATSFCSSITGHRQAPLLPPSSSSRPPLHHHQHPHPHHHQQRLIFENNQSSSSSTGCNTTAVLPSVPIPSIGTDISTHSGIQHSSSLHSNECNSNSSNSNSRLQFRQPSREQQQNHHQISSSNPNSTSQLSDSLYTSSSDYSNYGGLVNSLTESTLDQVDSQRDSGVTSQPTTTAAAVAPSSSNNSTVNPEVFTTDEDYWDLRTTSSSGSNQWKSQLYSSKTSLTGVDGDCAVAKKLNYYSSVITDLPATTTLGSSHTCKELLSNDTRERQYKLVMNVNTTHNPYSFYYSSSIEPGQCIYRRRLQQYRVCVCKSLLRRSFSANTNLQLIDISNKLQNDEYRTDRILRTMRSLDSCCVATTTTAATSTTSTTAATTTTNDEHNLIQNICNQYSRCCRTTESSNSNSNISISPPPPLAPLLSSGKLLCGGASAGAGRFQRIHRLFQRKHSQSHDSLQSRKNSMDDRPVIFYDSEYCITTGGDGDKSSFDKPLHSDMLPWDGIDELKQEQQQQQQEKHLNTSHTDNNNDKSVELSCRVLNCPRHGIRRLHWRNIDPQQILLLTNRKAENLSQLKKLMKSRVTTATATSNDFVVHHEKHSTPTILPSNSPNTVVVNNCTTAAAAAAAHYSPVVSGRWRNRRTHHHHYFTRKIDSKAKGLYLHENNSDSDLITSQAVRTNNCPQSSISSSEMKTHSLSPLRKHSSTSSAINQSNGGHYYYHYYYYHHHNAVSSPSERSQSLISVNSLPCSEPSLSKIDNHNSNIIMHSLLHMNYTDSMEQLLLLQLPPPSSSSSIHRYDSSVLLLKPTTTTTTNTSTTTNQQVVNSSELINTTDDDNGGESDKVCSKSSCSNCTMMQKTDSTDRQFDIPKFNRSVSSSSSVKPFALPSSTASCSSSDTTLRASTLPTTRILRDEQSINSLQLTTPYNHQQQHAYVNSRMNVVDNPESTHYHHQKSNRLQSSVSNLDRLLPALLLQRTSTRQNPIPSSVHDSAGVVVVSGSDNSMPRKFSYQSSEVDSSPRIVINNNNSNANTVSKKGRRRKSNEEVNDKTTALQVDEQLSFDIHTYNNLIRLQEYPNDDSTALHGLKSIPTSLSSSGYDPTTSQFLHLTIHEENDTSCQSQPSSSSPCSSASSSSTTSYVNFPGFWSNIHSTTSSSGIAVAASASASPSIVATTSSMENRLYANLIPKTNQKYTKHSYNNNNNSKGTLLSQLPMNNAHCDTITTSNCAGQSSLYTTGDNILHSTDSHYLPQTTTTTINLLSKSNSSGPPPTTTIISLGGGGNLMPSSTSQCCCSPMGGVHLHPAQAPPPPLPSVVNMPTETDYSCLPAEVRDPSRNYAMVDLRPSPASSTLPPTELTLSLNHQHHNTNEQHTSQSSSSSIDDSICSNSGVSLTHNSNSSNNNNSTSTTGSDCTSDAATLTSDTIENYSTVCCNPPHESSSLSYSNNSNNNSKAMNTSKVKSKNSSMDTDSCDHFLLNTMKSRRRHSHSLSSSLSSTAMMTTTTDPPILNYVHVIAASNTRFTSTETARSSDPGSVSDRHHIGGGGGIITELGNSPSSSSGLGGVTSQSNASSLAAPASSTSFGDIFSCRSMTSSGTSSVEGNNNIHINSNNPEMMMMMPTELSSCSPPDDNCVIYTQIDFTRTMALGELSNDIMAQENQIANNTNINNNNSNNRLSSSMIASRGNTTTTTTANTSSTGTTSSSSSRNKIDRTTSVKKTLYRSIRLIGGRGSRKKVG